MSRSISALASGGSILGSAGVVLCFLELRLELGDTVAHALDVVGRRRAGLIELGLELLGPVAVLGGFGAGDVEERLEVGGGSGGSVGVLLELGFELGGALGGLLGLLVELFLEPLDLGAGLGGSILGSVGVVLCLL